VGFKQIFTKRLSAEKQQEIRFQEVFNTYWKRMVAFSQHHCPSDDIAMDIVQDIFCSLWKRRGDLEVIVHMEHYLFRAVRIRISDYYREHYRRANSEGLMATTFCDITHNTEETIYYNDLDHFVNGLVNRLPCRCRQVYSLSRNSGLNIPEIARSLGLSEKTVEAHLTKALKFLRHNIPSS